MPDIVPFGATRDDNDTTPNVDKAVQWIEDRCVHNEKVQHTQKIGLMLQSTVFVCMKQSTNIKLPTHPAIVLDFIPSYFNAYNTYIACLVVHTICLLHCKEVDFKMCIWSAVAMRMFMCVCVCESSFGGTCATRPRRQGRKRVDTLWSGAQNVPFHIASTFDAAYNFCSQFTPY